ncbi:hypothetical protein AHF37_12262 [Paragonimus kellicotti]|nr:hypothetical protein AHF37_12262 [Paragonimus kellicotti]
MSSRNLQHQPQLLLGTLSKVVQPTRRFTYQHT